ncbi:MAG TPA: DinB family protein, partial [candidate division Zixibacteria bacterium]|nr:DinB family protein [candidate division Zixibacteria bacterium]
MFTKIEHFTAAWRNDSDAMLKILNALTDQSLSQSIAEGHRTLGRIAWHITTTIPEMMGHAGLEFPGLDAQAPVPKTAKDITETYAKASKMLLDAVTKNWTDATLAQEFDFYGQKWTGGLALAILMGHQTHHQGQMTLLMRQAGLKVP